VAVAARRARIFSSLFERRMRSKSRTIGLIFKRCFDLVVGGLLILILSPLLAALAAAIKLDSRGPVFFRQRRLGRDAREFRILKFRTMVPNAVRQGAGLWTHAGDPRVTRIGHYLRKYRLDEFPQLFNVLLGDMSLVGPRPLLPEFLSAYTDFDRRRMEMPQGMTGWQQTRGGSTDTWEQRVADDVWYVDHWSPWLDVWILIRTCKTVVKADTVFGKDGWQRCGVPTGYRGPEGAPLAADVKTDVEQSAPSSRT
jgi:lipopolysaccharide/colanic/teichoic acid biosynthesis glycosyltransferase